jgi:hypothetical protein
VIPGNKHQLVDNARNEVIKVEQQYLEGAITNGADRGPSRAKKLSEALRVRCPARGLEPPPAALEPPEPWSRQKASAWMVEKALLSLVRALS